MASEIFKPDANFKGGGVVGGYSSADAAEAASPTKLVFRINPTTMRLLVDVNGATVVTDGEAVDAADTGTIVLGTDGSNYQILKTDSDGNLQVDVLSGGGGGTQYTEGDTDASITGNALLFEGAANTLVAAPGTAADGLLVNLGANNDVVVTNAGTFVVQENGAALTALQLIDNAVSGAGFNITQFGGAAVPIGAGVEATALRITVATDSTGVLSIDDNGASITVDNAGLTALNGAITGTEVQVDVLTIPAVTNAGTFAVQVDGAALTALQLIDNLAVAVDGNYLNVNMNIAGVDVIGGAGIITAQTQRVTIATDDEVNNLLGTIDADTSTLAGAVSGTEMQVDVVAALPSGTNAIGKLAANSGVDIGDVDILSIAAGANLIGDVGISGARTSGGSTPYKNLDVDETEDQVKATAGQIYWIHAMNTGATPNYLKIYNATAATVVVGTTVPDLTFLVPANADSDGAGFTLAIPNGIAFGTAITIAATLNAADADATAPTGTIIVNLGYA